MAMAAGGAKKGAMSDINITPMIDVLLVLLIIFMVTLPLSRRLFEAQVPVEQQKKQQKQQTDQIVLELRSDGSYAVNNSPVALAQLDAMLHQIFDPRPAKLMFIKAAPNRKFREVVEAMDIARGAGVQVMSFTPVEKPKGGS